MKNTHFKINTNEVYFLLSSVKNEKRAIFRLRKRRTIDLDNSGTGENQRKMNFRSLAAERKRGQKLGGVGPGRTIRAWMKYHVWPEGMASECGWGGGSVVLSSTHGGGVLRGKRETYRMAKAHAWCTPPTDYERRATPSWAQPAVESSETNRARRESEVESVVFSLSCLTTKLARVMLPFSSNRELVTLSWKIRSCYKWEKRKSSEEERNKRVEWFLDIGRLNLDPSRSNCFGWWLFRCDEQCEPAKVEKER